jgi:DNA-binding MurR/RpiR family transcriptional regulator
MGRNTRSDAKKAKARGSSLLLFDMKLREAYPSMSIAERRVAEYVREHGKETVQATAKEIAERTGTSAATVVRFCRACGFSGLPELKVSLRREHEIAEGGYHAALVRDNDSMDAISRKVMGYHSMVINAMMSGLDEEAYRLAADAILGAKRILVVGEGGSQCTASCLTHSLLMLGLPCQTVLDPVFEALTIRNMSAGDVLVGITFTGRLQATIESFRMARERGVTTVGVIGMQNSPICPLTDVVLNSNLVERGQPPAFMSVRIAELSVVEVLFSLLSARLGETATKNIVDGLSVAEESRRIKRT